MKKHKEKETLTTEEKILRAAKEVFFHKGLDGARMQEIADKAGINKALLHYYFRSKDKLFMEIIKRATGEFFPSVIDIWGESLSFDEKVEKFVHTYITFIWENPDIPRFFINALNDNTDLLLSVIKIKDYVKKLNLQEILDDEARKGVIQKVDAYQFIITILSLCIFPAIAKPMFQTTLNISDRKYSSMMEERKVIAVEIILSWLKFNKKKIN